MRGEDWFLVAKGDERLGYVFAPLLAPDGNLEAIAAAVPARQAVQNPNAVAVIIGNKGYSGDTPEVDYAFNDADAMKKYVIEVLGYREENLIDLRDATLADFQRVFGNRDTERGQLFSWLKPGKSDVTVF